MSDSEKFLKRWSRRKQGAKQETTPDTSAEPSSNTGGEGASRASADPVLPPSGADRPAKATAQTRVQEFDVASLPPIESIVGGTDVRAFLAPGVPQHLTRAALRRAWSADPAIREYIGLSEYSWDFNAPDSMLGFEPLRASDDVKKLLAEVFSERDKPDDQCTTTPEAAPTSDTIVRENAEAAALPPFNPDDVPDSSRSSQQSDRDSRDVVASEPKFVQRDENSATQHHTVGVAPDGNMTRSRHGGALPKF